VGAHRLARRGGVAGAHRLEHRTGVVAGLSGRPVEREQHVSQKAVARRSPKLAEHRLVTLVARGVEALEISRGAPCGGQRRHRWPDEPAALAGVGQRRVALGAAEQRREQRGVEQVPLRFRRDRGPAAVLDREHAAVPQRLDALARHIAAHVVLGGQVDLARQALPHRVLAAEDRREDVAHDALVQLPPVCHAGHLITGRLRASIVSDVHCAARTTY
jgi:hypothetical protein